MLEVNLDGKAAVVTGGAAGIGRAIATHYAAAGACVVIADINGEAAHATAQKINASGGRSVGIRADVTDQASLEATVAMAESEFGRLDIMAANAGLAGYPTHFLDADPDEFDRIMAVNVKGVWLSARAAVPALRRAGGGVITVTGSVMGERARPGFAAYASSKAAANHLTRALALELAGDGIRVNAVAPVASDTGMLSHFLGTDDPEQAREAFIAGVPLGRLAVPEDVADAALFLASESAKFLTGVVLPVDGGRSI